MQLTNAKERMRNFITNRTSPAGGWCCPPWGAEDHGEEDTRGIRPGPSRDGHVGRKPTQKDKEKGALQFEIW